MKELTVQCKETKNTYQFIFSDGVIIEKDKTNLPSIDKRKPKSIILYFTREDDKWNNYVLWSDGEVEIMERECKCGLPKAKGHFTPTEYEMYITLFEKWVKNGKLEYTDDNTFTLTQVANQFENHQWLDDLTFHKFKCMQCQDELIISINTFRGGSSGFYRNETTEE